MTLDGPLRTAGLAVKRGLGWPARVVLDRRFGGLAAQMAHEYRDLRKQQDELRAELQRLSERVAALAARDGSSAGEGATPASPVALEDDGEGDLRSLLADRGFAVVRGLLTAAECARLLDELRRESAPPLDWFKGHAPSSRPFYEAATHPRILECVCDVLGPNVVLWGASLVTRPPGAVHAWHTDIESSAATGGTLSVWLGLENTSEASSLTAITGSHRLGTTIQETAVRHGRRRGEADDEEVEAWARELDPASRAVLVPTRDGDAVLFDGRLWHGSANRDPVRTRTALLLQYATSETPIRIPDFNQLEWPFRWLLAPRPPCLLVRGEASPGINRIVPAPLAPAAGAPARLSTHVQRLPVPFAPGTEDWRPYPLLHGTGPRIAQLGCHVSALAPGSSPHEPHRHAEEEILLVLHGEADLVLPELPGNGGGVRHRVRRGHLAYYPAEFPHTLEAVGDEPVNYLMFKWRGDGRAPGAGTLAPGIFDLRSSEGGAGAEGLAASLVFEGPTRWLEKLHCHVTTLEPGGGYEPHLDAYDVGIVTLEGEIEVLGHRVGPHHLLFFASGEAHDMRCVGTEPARYAVFEFHGGGSYPGR